MAPQRLGLREDIAIGVTEDAWEGYKIPSHLFGLPAKPPVEEPGLGVTARNCSALTVQGDSGPNGVSQSFAGTVEGEGPAVGTP